MKRQLILKGKSVCPGVVVGRARIVLNPLEHYDTFNGGEILVVKRTTPDYFPLMVISTGMIGEVGGTLSHLAINAIELNKPTIVAVEGATTKIKDGMTIILDATNGKVYRVF